MIRRHSTALIGCGRIGFLLENDPLRYKPCTHYGGAVAAGLAVTHACDIDGRRLSLFAKTAGIEQDSLSDNYRKLLRDARPDLVIIATWTESHERIAVEAARCGARVIVLEKPMAPSLPACRRILRACEKYGASLIINHERRYDGRYLKAKELIASGVIGSVMTVRASILTGAYAGLSDPGEGGGPLVHDGTHLIDILRFLLGDIVSVEGEFQRMKRAWGFEDRACAWLKTASGVDIFLEAGGNRRYFLFELDISGTDGAIVIGNGYQRLYRPRTSRWYTGFKDLDEVPFPKRRNTNPFKELYREAKRLLDGATDVTSSGEDGYRAMEVIHAVYYSAHLGGKRITLPLIPGRINLKKIFNLP